MHYDTAPTTPPPPVLNLDEALARVDGDRQLLGELAALFLDTYPSLLTTLEAALAHGDAKAVQHAAHTLKGAVGNFGAQSAFAAALALEQLGRQGNLSGSDIAFACLRDELARLQPALAALVTSAEA
jgi:HPt (histidine-containing phosphotransfer) domain-containing protein